MRKLFLFCTAIIFCLNINAQDSADLQTMKQKIDSLQHRLDDGNYTRIPKQDFDNILKNAVTNEVNESIKKWIAFLGTLIGLVGVFIAAYFKNQIKSQVDEALKNNLGDINLKIDKQKDDGKDENSRQDNKLAELTKRIDKILADQLQVANDNAILIDKKIKDILSFAWDDIADAKLRLAEEKKFNGEELIQEITAFLESVDIQIRKEKRIALIDALMRCYFTTLAKNEEEKYKSMIQLLRKYETDNELLPDTYANAAIALSNSYQKYSVKADRDTCIESCDKSISKLKGYGEPYAIKLEVFMMDYKKAFDDKERNEAIENIKRTFNAIKNNTAKLLCLQIIDRLNRDSIVVDLKETISDLERLFSDDLMDVRERLTSDITYDTQYFNLDSDKQMLNNILQSDMLKSVDVNGNWKCNKLLKAGTETDPAKSIQNILFKDYNYSLTRNGILETGLVHFLPNTKNTGLNLYKKENKEEDKREDKEDIFIDPAYGIYKIENDELVICLNEISHERPQEFLSTPQNKFVLAFFTKEV